MDVSENSGTPKSSILIGLSIINHPFRGTPSFGNTHMSPLAQAKFVSLAPEFGPLGSWCFSLCVWSGICV